MSQISMKIRQTDIADGMWGQCPLWISQYNIFCIFIILYNELTHAQQLTNYYTVPTCLDTTVSSSGSL